MDDISGLFDRLTPEQFATNSSFLTRRVGGAGFAGFLTEHLEMLRYSFASCDGAIHPIAAVADEEHIRYFKAADDESMGALVARLADFSRAHRGRCLFLHKKVAAPVAGELVDIVYWLAGRRDAQGRAEYRQGYFEIDHQVLGACVETDVDRQPDGVRAILEYAG